jgi:exosortase
MNGLRSFGAIAGIWLAILLFAHRSILSLLPRSKAINPIEAFFFDAGTTIPALHLALFALVLIHRRKSISAALSDRGAPVPGSMLAGLGVALLAWAKFTRQIDLEIDSLVLVLAGSGLILGGWRLLERLVLPLALLWLARPLPPMLVHHLHEWLQRATGTFAQTVLDPFSPVERSGHLLFFQERLFIVIEGCCGLRLEITLIAATLVYLAFISRRRRQTFGVLGLAILLGPLMNGLRVVSIMLNPNSEVSLVHATQGLVFVSLGVGLIAALDRLLESRAWPASGQAIAPDPGTDPLRRITRRQQGMIGVITFLCLGASVYPYDRPRPLEAAAWALHEVRPQMGHWQRSRALELDRDFLGSVQFGNKLYWEFEREGGSGLARVFVASDSRRRRDKSGFSPKTRLQGSATEVLESISIRLDTSPFEAERLIQRMNGERWLTLHYRINQVSLFEASARWFLAFDVNPKASPDELVIVRIDVRIDEGNPAAALAQLSELQAEVAQALFRAAPGRETLEPQKSPPVIP